MAKPRPFLPVLFTMALALSVAGCSDSPKLGEINLKLPPPFDLEGRPRDPAVVLYVEKAGPYPAHPPGMMGGTAANASDAYRVTCEAVSAHLYAPGSALFAPPHEATVGGAVDSGTQSVSVDSYVDVQNTAGAHLRATFNAHLRSDRNQWTIEALTMSTVPLGGEMIQPAGAFPSR